jgi:hypothetical protein
MNVLRVAHRDVLVLPSLKNGDPRHSLVVRAVSTVTRSELKLTHLCSTHFIKRAAAFTGTGCTPLSSMARHAPAERE